MMGKTFLLLTFAAFIQNAASLSGLCYIGTVYCSLSICCEAENCRNTPFYCPATSATTSATTSLTTSLTTSATTSLTTSLTTSITTSPTTTTNPADATITVPLICNMPGTHYCRVNVCCPLQKCYGLYGCSVPTSPTTSVTTSMTTSPTTSATTSMTTSPTTSVTTSMTTSPTTSVTTSMTTSMTTSITTSVTTSMTTSMTTSITTSVTTSMTTSMTTSITTSVTTSMTTSMTTSITTSVTTSMTTSMTTSITTSVTTSMTTSMTTSITTSITTSVTTSATTPAPSCAYQSYLSRFARAANAQDATDCLQAPGFVSIQIVILEGEPAFPLCGAVLISETEIQTSEQCVDQITTGGLPPGTSLSVLDFNDNIVASITDTTSTGGVLTLDSPITFSAADCLLPACLPDSSMQLDYSNCNLYAPGVINELAEINGVQTAPISISGPCASNAANLCSDSTTAQACLGDLGSPLVCPDQAGNLVTTGFTQLDLASDVCSSNPEFVSLVP